MGGQFWSVWVPTEMKGFEAVQVTLEQMDLVKRMAERYSGDFEMAYSAADVRRIHRAHKIAAMIGIEGGHQINNSLAVLRQNLAIARGFKPMTSEEMETLSQRCARAAGDGHLELYKSTMKYDGDVGREQHGLPSHKELPL